MTSIADTGNSNNNNNGNNINSHSSISLANAGDSSNNNNNTSSSVESAINSNNNNENLQQKQLLHQQQMNMNVAQPQQYQHLMHPEFLRSFYSPTPPLLDFQNQLNDNSFSGGGGSTVNPNLLQRATSPSNADQSIQQQLQFISQQQARTSGPTNPMYFQNAWTKPLLSAQQQQQQQIYNQQQQQLYNQQQQHQIPYLLHGVNPQNSFLPMQQALYQQLQFARGTPPLRSDDEENGNLNGQYRFPGNFDMDPASFQGVPNLFQRPLSPARNLPPPIIPNLNYSFNEDNELDQSTAAARASSAMNFMKANNTIGSLPASPSSSFPGHDSRFSTNMMAPSTVAHGSEDIFSNISGMASPGLTLPNHVNNGQKNDQNHNTTPSIQNNFDPYMLNRQQFQYSSQSNNPDFHIPESAGSVLSANAGNDNIPNIMSSHPSLMNNNGAAIRSWDSYNHYPLDLNMNQQLPFHTNNHLERLLTTLRSSSTSPAFDLFGSSGLQQSHQQHVNSAQQDSSLKAQSSAIQTQKKPVKKRKATTVGPNDAATETNEVLPKPTKRKKSEPGPLSSIMKNELQNNALNQSTVAASCDPPTTKRASKIGSNVGWKNDYASILSSLDRKMLLCVQSELSRILVAEVKVITRHANNSNGKRPSSARRLTVSIDKDGNEYVMRKVLPHRHKDITKSCVACAVRSMLNKANDIISGKLVLGSNSSIKADGLNQLDENTFINDPEKINQAQKIIVESIGLAHGNDMFSEEAAIRDFQEQ